MRKNGLSHIIIIPIINHNLLSGFVGLECKNKSSIWLHKYDSLIKILSEILSYTYSNYLAEKLRLEAEDELLTLMRAVSQSPTVIMIMDNKCTIEFVNPRFMELTGLSSKEVIGTVPSFLNPELNPKFNPESFWQLIGNGKRWEQKFQETNISGTTFWENISVSPIMNYRNDVTNLIAVIEDVTEKMVADSRTAISQKLESIGQLAAGIAHEINTPMQYIGDNTKFVKDTVNNLSNYLFEIQDLFNTSPEIPEQFQSKIGQLKVQYDLDYLLDELPRSIDQTELGIAKVSNLVRAMKDFAHPGVKEKAFTNINKGIEVTVEISKNEWKYVADIELNLSQELPLVYCLQDELNQVILNMIINSSHAIEEKNGKGSSQKGKIIIETFKENEFVVINVSDTGMGIKESIINKIFDLFFTTKEVGKGTGQGLAIVHDLIVNKHNGTITVDSTYGTGTKFIIKIPIGLNEGMKND
jgi:PAS domain S-box-containing protein